MTNTSAALAYREASLQQASPVGLVIMLYDAMIRDLNRAISAMQAGDIVGRCNALKHGFLILQQLEGLLDMKRGGVTAENLRRFYSHMRTQMLAAQFKRSPEILERQIRLLLEVRGAWQQVDSPGEHRNQPVPSTQRDRSFELHTDAAERSSFTCTV